MQLGSGSSTIIAEAPALNPASAADVLTSSGAWDLQVVKGQVWCFQQPQNLAGSNVHTNVRMTAVKLRSGGLMIYAPIAATK